MQKFERVIAAIEHKETDFTPYHIGFTKQAHEKVANYLGDPDFEGGLGSHVELVRTDGPDLAKEVSTDMFRDEFGVMWDRSGVDKDIGVISGLVFEEPDISQLDILPMPDEPAARDLIDKLLNNGKDTFKAGAFSLPLYERAWSARGMDNLLTDMLTEPEFVHALFDKILEYNMRLLDIYLEYDGLHAIYIGDDWGSQRGLIMGPKLWREFIKPRIAAMFDRIKASGKYVILHSCGDNWELFPELIEMGLDVYNTYQPEIYKKYPFKEEFGKDLAVWGGISTQELLPFATTEVVKSETARMIRELGKGGGYIAAPTHWMPGDIPAENIMAMAEVMQNQEKYV